MIGLAVAVYFGDWIKALVKLSCCVKYIIGAKIQYFVGILGSCGGFLCLFNMKSVIGKCFVIRKTHISSFWGVRIY